MTSIRTRRRATVLALLAVALQGPAVARAQSEAAGQWEGAIETPGTELGVIVDLSVDADGAWSGEIDIPVQGAEDLPLSGITVDGRSVRFSIRGIPGDPTFDGMLSDDGSSITGDFTQGGQTFPFHLARAGAAVEPRRPSAREALGDFDEFVRSSMRRWNVPGMAIAIVRSDSVILARGYGHRDLENHKPVTPQTLFAIGSASKAFTAMTLAMTADDGLIEWDEPVQTYLPGFRLKDEFASERMTPLDLVIHDSGLPRHDLVWYGSEAPRAELFRRLRHLEPNADFRARFQYQNLMFMTAGYLAGQVTGSTWEDLVRARIFTPLDMTESNFSVTEMQRSADYALGYREKDDSAQAEAAATNGERRAADEPAVERIPFRVIDNVGPAGSINSSAAEMSSWVQLHLNDGMANGTRLVSPTNLQKMHSPQMVVSGGLFSAIFQQPEMPYLMYGMGWFIQPYRGHPMIHHGGNIDGFSALVSFMPRDDLGLVILTNLNGTPLPTVVALNVYDRFLGLEPIDWNARYEGIWSQVEAMQDQGEALESIDRKEGTRPSHPVNDYVGLYSNPAYGTVRIEQDGDHLRSTFHEMNSRLEHWHYDIFRVTDEPAEGTKVAFQMNVKGDIDRLSAALEPNVEPIVFTREPPEELSDPEFLRQFTGDYEIMGAMARVALRGERTLTVTVPGQPTYELVPYRGTEFTLKGLKGYSLRFQIEDGEVVKAIFIQPNGVFAAEKKKPG